MDVRRLQGALAHVRDDSFFVHLRRLLRAKLRINTLLALRFTPTAAPEALSIWLPHHADDVNAFVPYLRGAYRLDPFYQFRGVPETGGLYRLAEIAPDRFFAGEYYLQYYRQTKLCDEVGLLRPLPDGSIAHLSFSRLEKVGPYRRKELQCLHHFGPLLLELMFQHFAFRLTASQRQTADARPLPDIIRATAAERRGVALTPRETEVAGLVLQGHSNASAALTLGISRETAKVHRRNIYRKLTISSQAELFALLKDLR
jgi:DNA-binding CsgD family transcriptional regulator